jgi:uncharacterized cupin superfamily protein
MELVLVNLLETAEMEATFRGKKLIVRAGDYPERPSNAPHQFLNTSAGPVRLLCICSSAGQEKFFMKGWGTGSYSDDAPTEARRKRASGIHRKGEGARAQVSH